jgi:signal transduction histidine kinase
VRASLTRVLGGLLSAAALVLAVTTPLVVPRDSITFTTYAGASPAADVAEVAAGLALVGAVLAAWLVRPDRVSVRAAVSVATLAWVAPRWIGWEDGPATARSLAMVLAPLLVPAVAHAVLVTSWHPRRRGSAVLIAGLYAWTGAVSLAFAVARDPFLDLTCWSNCSDNVFLLDPQPDLVRVLVDVWAATYVGVGVLLVVYGLARLARVAPVGRRAWWPVLLAGVIMGSALATYGLLLLSQPVENPREPGFATTHLLLAVGLLALACSITWVFARAHRARRAIAQVAADLGAAPAPGSLRATLARGVGDPALVVGYPAPDADRYVDADGVPVDTAVPGRAATSLVRSGEEVAVVVHDAATVDADLLRSELGAAALLAVENERLQARLLAELENLRASRARIVESADAERRALERNLHDGVQQQLLALLYDVQLALAAAQADGDTALAERLGRAKGHARQAVTELRELAHGIYPAVLTESGLAAALWTLTDDLDIPVELDVADDGRQPPSVERTAFLVVSEALATAQERAAGCVTIRVRSNDECLGVSLTGVDLDDDPHLADRVGAVGGMLRVDGQRLELVLPLASDGRGRQRAAGAG